MKEHLGNFQAEESAVTSIEYAILAALIATVIFVAVGNTGTQLGAFYAYVANCVRNATNSASGGGQ
jgi:Flp pilus assembly pilin Flp